MDKRSIDNDITQKLKKAMKDKNIVEIVYNGGTVPNQPRLLQPIDWKQDGFIFDALCFNAQQPKVKCFATNKVVSVEFLEEYSEEEEDIMTSDKEPKEEEEFTDTGIN